MTAVAVVRWTILVLALIAPYLASSHDLVDKGNGTATTLAPVQAVYIEGAGMVNVSTSATSKTVHKPVKKRILPVNELPEQSPKAALLPPVVVPSVAEPPKAGDNATTAKTVPAATMDKPQSVGNSTSTSTTDKNAVVVNAATTDLVANNSTKQAEKPVVEPPVIKKATGNGTSSTAVPAANVTTSTASTTTTTTSTTTKTTTTTTTTTPKPKKPTITVSLDDDPSIVHVPSVKSIPSPAPHVPVFHNNLDVEEPIAQLSRENLYEEEASNQRRRNGHRDLIIPVISLIFTIPMLLGLVTLFVRKFRGYWQTRHYRRMDFLVDGIYNDC